jgi:hypothetical protein
MVDAAREQEKPIGTQIGRPQELTDGLYALQDARFQKPGDVLMIFTERFSRANTH